jgi:hypothetical protein
VLGKGSDFWFRIPKRDRLVLNVEQPEANPIVAKG